jgi:hypothetical protein
VQYYVRLKANKINFYFVPLHDMSVLCLQPLARRTVIYIFVTITPCVKLQQIRSPSLFYLLVHSRCQGFVISLDHTQAHTTVGRTPLDEGLARRRDLYLTTQTLYKANIHSPGGIRTHDRSKRSPADFSLRPWLRRSQNQHSTTVWTDSR